MPAPTAASFEFAEFTVDLGQRMLYRRGEPVPLPSRAFDTLVYLIENRHRCVRKDEIIGTIWHDVVVTDDSLIHAISVLRRALGDERHQPKFIQTVPRRGYRFVAAIERPRAAEAPPPADASAAEVGESAAAGELMGSPAGATHRLPELAESPSAATRRAPELAGSPSGAMRRPPELAGSLSAATGQPSELPGSPSAATGQPSELPGSPSAATGQPSGLPGSPSAATGQPSELPGSPSAATRGPTIGRGLRLFGGGIGAAAAAAAAAAALLWLGDSRPPAGASLPAGIQLFQPAPAGASLASGGVLSPDGKYLAFVASDDETGRTGLWIRTLHTDSLKRIEGSDNASKPFWSPDSRQVAYFGNGKLNATDLASGATRTITTVFAAGGGTWGSDGTILYAEWPSGLYAVPASGDGNAREIATLDREEEDIAFAWPQFFPDDRRFLYQVRSLDRERAGVYVGDLKTQQSVKLLDTTSFAALAPPHHLLHVKNDLLIADEIDLERLELTGRGVVVARGVSGPSLGADDVVSASSGLLAFRNGVVTQAFTWVDRNGQHVGSLTTPTPLFNPRLSRDGSALLGSGSVTADPGLWLVSLGDEEYSRLEQDAIGPIWSPDGEQVALTARGGLDVIVRSLSGAAERRLLMSDDRVKILNDWSPDGRRLIYTRHDESTGLDLWVIDAVTGATEPLLATPHSETQARISPDGQSIAYVSDESGVLESYVARFPSMEDATKVSVGGGGQPQWRSDQRELFYLSLERAVMSVEVGDGDRPASLIFGPPRQLFRAPIAGDPGDARDLFAVNADGTRFLIDHALRDEGDQAITVMVNWSLNWSGGTDASDTARLSRLLP